MAEVRLKRTEAYKLAYIEHVGDYGKIPFNNYISQLFGWAGKKNIRPSGPPLGIFYDDPEQVAPEKCRSEVGIPIHGDAAPEGSIKIKDVPAMEVVVIEHAGSAKEYEKTYESLFRWIAQNGYRCAGPTIEIYGRQPETVGGETIIYAEVQAPVRKK